MHNEKRAEYVRRDTILKFLSDDEIARASTAETALRLADGEEYIDLQEPDRGIQRAAPETTPPMGRVLVKSAVREKIWRDIVILLSAHRSEREASRST